MVSPTSQAIEEKGSAISMLPVIYEMKPIQGQLVVLVRNASGGTVTISAEAVTADGKVHTLPGGTVGPAEVLKLILPPTQPPPGLAGGTQFGVSDTTAMEHPGRFGAPVGPSPSEGSDSVDRWDWTGELELRVTVVGTEETTSQTLRIRRD